VGECTRTDNDKTRKMASVEVIITRKGNGECC
jgi:hypothetical protein